MGRLLTFLIMMTLVLAQGSSIADGICRHQSAEAHALARQSHDRKIAAAAIAEETAASVEAKKAAVSGAGSASWAADMLPPVGLSAPSRIVERVIMRIADAPPLAGRSVRPLLEPPLA